jgi:outer membrane protein OmpA-like peptidoglycan-associated protein
MTPTNIRNFFTQQLMLISWALTLGIFIGYFVSPLRRDHGSEQATSRLADELSKPLTLNVNLNNPASSETVNPLLVAVANVAADAIETTGKTVTDTATLPREAAKKFVSELSSGLGGEIGKKPVDGFSELISSGFKPSDNKNKDVQVVTNILMNNLLPIAERSLAPTQRLEMQTRVVFEVNEARLMPAANTTIGAVRDFAMRHPSTIILLSANADTLGSQSWNRNLAAKRSKAVLDRLASVGGIALNRVFIANLATTALPVLTPSHTGEQQNRSVSIEVRE